MPVRVALPAAATQPADLAALPARPGVLALEDGDDRTLLLAITANIRRLARARLAPPAASAGPSPCIDFRGETRAVAAVTCGSPLEAEWAYLQLARQRLPGTAAALLDRWRGWFVRCDPEARFPRFLKWSTADGAAGAPGLALGPVADKHAARRLIELTEDAFDLCRYHHLLVQAPHAAACAYKEMGRCPAPCDGSISMTTYRRMMREAIGFLAGEAVGAEAKLERAMHEAGAALDFEAAARIRRRIEAMAERTRPAFSYVARLDRFRYLAVLPAEQPTRVRLMVIAGGWIAPWADVPRDLPDTALAALAEHLAALHERPVDLSAEGLQNLGLVCRHLFRPRAALGPGQFLPLRAGLDHRALRATLRRLDREERAAGAGTSIAEASLEP